MSLCLIKKQTIKNSSCPDAPRRPSHEPPGDLEGRLGCVFRAQTFRARSKCRCPGWPQLVHASLKGPNCGSRNPDHTTAPPVVRNHVATSWSVTPSANLRSKDVARPKLPCSGSKSRFCWHRSGGQGGVCPSALVGGRTHPLSGHVLSGTEPARPEGLVSMPSEQPPRDKWSPEQRTARGSPGTAPPLQDFSCSSPKKWWWAFLGATHIQAAQCVTALGYALVTRLSARCQAMEGADRSHQSPA